MAAGKNSTVRISSFGNESVAARMLAMGILPGAEVAYVRKAPFKGAYYLKINGQSYAFRKEEFLSIEFSDTVESSTLS